jgi:hypothetical protein
MARFEIGVPVETAEASVEVDAGLELGRHRFRLQVVAADGRASAPVEVVVEIVRGTVTPDPRGTVASPDPVLRRPTPR